MPVSWTSFSSARHRLRALGDGLVLAARAGARFFNRSLLLHAFAIFAVCLLAGCASDNASGQRASVAKTASPSATIYVADFEFDAQNIQHESGMLTGRSAAWATACPEPPRIRRAGPGSWWT